MVAFKIVLAALLSALVATAMPLPFPQSDDSVSVPAAAANTPVTGSGPIAGDSIDESIDQSDWINGDGGSAQWKKKRQTGPIAGDSSDESTDQTDSLNGDGGSALWKKRQTDDDDTTIDVGPIAGDSSDTNIVEADLFAAGSEDFWKRKE